MADLAMKHLTHEADAMVYYYDGELPVKAGVVVIPDGRDDLFTRVWQKGYRRDPVTGKDLNPEDARALLSTESAEEKVDEAPDAGRQPADRDRVRAR